MDLKEALRREAKSGVYQGILDADILSDVYVRS
jgi:hypothetical protein